MYLHISIKSTYSDPENPRETYMDREIYFPQKESALHYEDPILLLTYVRIHLFQA